MRCFIVDVAAGTYDAIHFPATGLVVPFDAAVTMGVAGQVCVTLSDAADLAVGDPVLFDARKAEREVMMADARKAHLELGGKMAADTEKAMEHFLDSVVALGR